MLVAEGPRVNVVRFAYDLALPRLSRSGSRRGAKFELILKLRLSTSTTSPLPLLLPSLDDSSRANDNV